MVTTLEKIRVLGEHGKYDICASTASNRSQEVPDLFKISNPNSPQSTWIGNTAAGGICHSYTPDGRCVSLFKVLYTNRCIFNCKYCFTNTCKERLAFTPAEYARTFMKLYTMNVAEGIFMSSAICGSSDETTKEMLEAVRLLRFKYGFRGYIHFKCLPGTSAYLLKEALLLSDRISVNLEAPTKEYLADIAEQKNYNTDIITRQRWLREMRIRHNTESKKMLEEQGVNIRQNRFQASPNLESEIRKAEWKDEYGQTRLENGYLKFRWDGGAFLHSGQTTQFCLGAAGESDFDILKRLDWEYKEIDLRRGYFSAFTPIEGTPLERLKATPLDREHRLYQTDWLLRIYQYPLKEVKEILTDHGDLPKGDPKVHLARKKFEDNGPIDINRADFHELLTVPGLGPLSAKRIIALRKENKPIESRLQLKKLGVALTRADPFIALNGHHQTSMDGFFQ